MAPNQSQLQLERRQQQQQKREKKRETEFCKIAPAERERDRDRERDRERDTEKLCNPPKARNTRRCQTHTYVSGFMAHFLLRILRGEGGGAPTNRCIIPLVPVSCGKLLNPINHPLPLSLPLPIPQRRASTYLSLQNQCHILGGAGRAKC